MRAFDLDGVIAVKPPMPPKKWGRMNGRERQERLDTVKGHYLVAEPILHPDGDYTIITARKADPEIMMITEHWLKRNNYQPRQIIYFAGSRSIEAVVKFKAHNLKQLKASEFTEDNMAVLRGLVKTYPECDYYFFDGVNTKLIHKGL